MTTPRVFISYRRDDRPDMAGRIFDRLAHEFGDDNVFIDLESIRPGRDFRDDISTEIGRSTVVVVIIGPGWTPERLYGPDDVVRFEIEQALARQIPIVPVLLDTTQLPGAPTVPARLRPFLRRNALRLHRDQFRTAIKQLIQAVHDPGPQAVEHNPSPRRVAPTSPPKHAAPTPPIRPAAEAWARPNNGPAVRMGGLLPALAGAIVGIITVLISSGVPVGAIALWILAIVLVIAGISAILRQRLR